MVFFDFLDKRIINVFGIFGCVFLLYSWFLVNERVFLRLFFVMGVFIFLMVCERFDILKYWLKLNVK